MNAPVIECRDLTAAYGRIQVVSGVTLEAAAGEVLAIIGANGAGKSSLLGALSGTVRSTGSVQLGGRRLDGLSANQRALRGLAFVPEARRNIFRAMSTAENLEIGLSLQPRGDRAATLDLICELFPILRDRMAVSAGMLSGGEQQMLAIGVALGRNPRALLLDEPTQGLAPAVFDVLQVALARLQASGVALLLAEQNLAFTARVASRYVVLVHGQIAASGQGNEMADLEAISLTYLGHAA
jgi:branched-chain amino acid transport system ATP-binding protein